MTSISGPLRSISYPSIFLNLWRPLSATSLLFLVLTNKYGLPHPSPKTVT